MSKVTALVSDPRAFIEGLEGGQLLADWHELIREGYMVAADLARDTKRKRSFTVTFRLKGTLSPLGAMTIVSDLASKLPPEQRKETMLFVTKAGDCSVIPPEQLEMFGTPSNNLGGEVVTLRPV